MFVLAIQFLKFKLVLKLGEEVRKQKLPVKEVLSLPRQLNQVIVVSTFKDIVWIVSPSVDEVVMDSLYISLFHSMIQVKFLNNFEEFVEFIKVLWIFLKHLEPL